jgi:hypothetical protein
MTPTAMSRRTPPRPSATARSRFFFAGSSSASAARANAAASASTIESAEGQVPSSLRARSVTPQTAFPRLRCTAAALSEHARLPKAGRSSDRFHAQYPRIRRRPRQRRGDEARRSGSGAREAPTCSGVQPLMSGGSALRLSGVKPSGAHSVPKRLKTGSPQRAARTLRRRDISPAGKPLPATSDHPTPER